jgi:hypothetical protein
MKLAIQNLLAAPVDDAAIANFLQAHTFPIVEGRQTTFIFHGQADAVRLRHWVYGLASSQPFHRIKNSAGQDTNLWYHTLELPPQSRVEYKLEIVEGQNARWIQDPLNPNLAHDPFGANSVAHGRGYKRPDWTEPDPEARTGTIKEMIFAKTPLGGPRGSASTCPRGSASRVATPSSSSTTAATTFVTRRCRRSSTTSSTASRSPRWSSPSPTPATACRVRQP